MRPTHALAILLSLAAACERREETTTQEAPRPTPTTLAERPAEPAPPAAPRPRAAPIEVSFAAADGVIIHGTLRPGVDPNAGAVVLAHQLGSSRAEWAPIVEALGEEPALTTLAIDLRGHGDSNTDPEGHALSYGDFETADWEAMQLDVAAAVAYLRSGDSPVNPLHIAVVGASIGATAVVRAASSDRTLDVIATLSPGRAYRGVDSILVAMDMGHRSFLGLAGREEADSVETAEALARITGGRTELVDGAAHGVALFAESPDLVGVVAGFLRENLARPAPGLVLPAPEATHDQGEP